ncbi:hypothetical protein KIL84_004204, partial [Mauremys mutica]
MQHPTAGQLCPLDPALLRDAPPGTLNRHMVPLIQSPSGACLFVSRRYKKMMLPELASAPTAELEESIRHYSRKRRALQDEMWESR